MRVEDAAEIAREYFIYKAGAFYGTHFGLDLGVGLIYDNIPFAIFDEEERLFDTASGLVYVLRHECDVSQLNQRFLNEYVLICPIIDYQDFITASEQTRSDEQIRSFATDLVKDRISRASFLPSIDRLVHGGILYFNQITNTHVSNFELVGNPICALSSYAQHIVDMKMQNHLLRPKEQRLPRVR